MHLALRCSDGEVHGEVRPVVTLPRIAPRLAAWPILLLLGLTALPFRAAAFEQAPDHVKTPEEASKWADRAYGGMFHLLTFRRHSEEVLVVVGSFTSGLPSAEITVFNRGTDGVYWLMLTRTLVLATVKVAENEHGISFRTATRPLLFIPWTGVFDPSLIEPK
jgi:hypothetical protein